jgi:phage host-nuclease inhibitor protein Gam
LAVAAKNLPAGQASFSPILRTKGKEMDRQKNNSDARENLIKSIDQRLQFVGLAKKHLSGTVEDMEKEMDAIRKKYTGEIELLEVSIEAAEKQLKSDMRKLNLKWGLKTLKFLAGFIKVRPGKYCVKTLNEKITEGTAIALLRAIYGAKYIRTIEELNKEAIIKAYAGKLKLLSDKDLAECGLRIDREESISYKIANPPAADSEVNIDAANEGLSDAQDSPTPFTKGGQI